MKLLCERCRPSIGTHLNPGPCANCGDIGTHYEFNDFAIAVRSPGLQPLEAWPDDDADDSSPADLVEAATVIAATAALSPQPEREPEAPPDFTASGGDGGGAGASEEY